MKAIHILKNNEMVKKYVEPNYLIKAIEIFKLWKQGYCTEDDELDEAIEELESLKCCQNCKHYSMFDGKIECKTCFAINHTNWEIK